MATSRAPKPLDPTVKLMQPDGTPTRDFHTYLTKMFEEVRRPGQDSDFQPTTAKLAAAAPVGTLVATLTTKGSFPPVAYVVRDNVDNLKVALTAGADQKTADVKTNGTPVGTVGTHTLGIRATDAQGRTYQGALLVTLT